MSVKKKYIKKEGRTKTGTKSEYRVFAWKPTQKATTYIVSILVRPFNILLIRDYLVRASASLVFGSSSPKVRYRQV